MTLECINCGYEQHESSNYCPSCGEEWEDNGVDYPIVIDHYVHKQANRERIEEEWGFPEEYYPELYETLRYVGYEEKLTYEIREKGTPRVIAVNGREVKD